ncbi:MAG TPA: hypothetical protein VFQ61_33570 [Polyangiaceae bacterium]|nr:hypothetical protein [Polyangiaceae bacterium]
MTLHSCTRFTRWFSCAALLGCAAPAQETAPRSPTLDYPHPAPRTSDGEVIGADGVDPTDKLRQGPTVGTPTAPGPGWKAEEGKLKPDPGGPGGSEPNPRNGPPP